MKKISKDSKFFPVLLALFAALPLLAVNTYSPAIPLIANSFSINSSDVLTTLTSYFIGATIGMFVWGAISDKYGRKNVLLIGMIIYTISTILCAESTSFDTLIYLRFIQGLADSVGGVIAFSIARDCYKGHQLTKTIASIVIVMLIAPIIAPIIGTILTSTFDTWQSTFHFLTIYGVILIAFIFMIEETLAKKDCQGNLKTLIPSYIEHFKNPVLILAAIASGSLFASMFIYISAAPILYLNIYNDSPLMYCIYYAIAVTASIVANITIKRLPANLDYLKFGTICAAILIALCFALLLINLLKIDNSFTYTVFMAILCFLVSFGSILFFSYSINSAKNNFGTANSIVNSLKNLIAGGSAFIISFYHGKEIIVAASFYQIIFAVIAIIMAIIIFMIKIKSTKLKNL